MKILKTLYPDKNDLSRLNNKFREFALTQILDLPAETDDKPFLFSAYVSSEFVGGISGSVYWNGLEIDTLWVDENYRKCGIGNSLLNEAETFALENDAVVSFLKTVDATAFYEKAGYEVYGQLEDRPIGTVLYHMKKRLQ